MVVKSNSQQSTGTGQAYAPPKLTKFGAIEEWTRGAPGLINISVVIH